MIEVILATTILAVGLTSMMAAVSRCLAVAGKAREYEVARRLVGQVDLEIPPDFEELEEGIESGRFASPFDDYQWEREIVEFDDEEFQMFLVRTRVTWSTKGRDAFEETMSYIYGPTYPRGGQGGRR